MTISEYRALPIDRRLKIERDAKNEAYSFILKSGLFDEFTKFSREHRKENHFEECADMITKAHRP